MKPAQNFKNHSRLHTNYHFITGGLLLFTFIGALVNLYHSWQDDNRFYSAFLLVSVCLILVGIWWYARFFALRAQDRAIRAEESFRYFALTGKLLPATLNLKQIIALRFAPDEEFILLCTQAARENMGSKEIKKSIKNWRSDYHRV